MNVTKIVVFCLLWSNLVKVKFKCMQDKKPTFVLKKLQFYFRLIGRYFKGGGYSMEFDDKPCPQSPNPGDWVCPLIVKHLTNNESTSFNCLLSDSLSESYQYKLITRQIMLLQLINGTENFCTMLALQIH